MVFIMLSKKTIRGIGLSSSITIKSYQMVLIFTGSLGFTISFRVFISSLNFLTPKSTEPFVMLSCLCIFSISSTIAANRDATMHWMTMTLMMPMMRSIIAKIKAMAPYDFHFWILVLLMLLLVTSLMLQ